MTIGNQLILAMASITKVQIGCNIHQLSHHVNLSGANKSRPTRRIISAEVAEHLSITFMCLPLDLVRTVPLAPRPVSAVEIKGEGA